MSSTHADFIFNLKLQHFKFAKSNKIDHICSAKFTIFINFFDYLL